MIKSVVRNRIFKFVINFIYQISTFRTIVKVFLIEIERTSSQSLRTQMLMFHMSLFIRVIQRYKDPTCGNFHFFFTNIWYKHHGHHGCHQREWLSRWRQTTVVSTDTSLQSVQPPPFSSPPSFTSSHLHLCWVIQQRPGVEGCAGEGGGEAPGPDSLTMAF